MKNIKRISSKKEIRHEMLGPDELKRKLQHGERIPNPIIGWSKCNGDEIPRYLYHHMLLRVIANDIKADLIQDFDKDEVYLKLS